MLRLMGLLVAAGLLLAGCSEAPPAPEATPTATPTPTPDPDAAAQLFNGTAPAPANVRFNQSFEFFVTYVSAAQGGGTNAGQRNCAWFSPVTMANATATAVWTAKLPGEEQLELVMSNFQGTANTQRVQGTSPLRLDFALPLTANDVIVAVQSLPFGAVQQLPVTLTVAFDHPEDEQPAAEEATCAF